MLLFDDIVFKKKFNGVFSQFELFDKKVMLLKPTTYMNDSGISVAECLRFYKIPSREMIVIYDDMNLDFGRAKIQFAVSDGGHNGIKSIDSLIGKDYYRMRFGISRPIGIDVKNYVLSNFYTSEIESLERLLEIQKKNLRLLIERKFDHFINNYAKCRAKNNISKEVIK